jgi:hypothetical protein
VGVLWLQENDRKLHEHVLVLLPASIVASGGRRWHVTAAARAKVAAQFGSKYTWYWALFIGVLDRIVDSKNPNTFLVSVELYLMKIKKKSRRAWIRVGYDNGNRIFDQVSTG